MLSWISSRKTTILLIFLLLFVLFSRSQFNVKSELLLVFCLGALFLHLVVSLLRHFPVFKRKRGALIFHVGLLLLLLGAMWGRLTYFQGYFELAEGESFRGDFLQSHQGPLHRYGLRGFILQQGPIRTRYSPRGRLEEVESQVGLFHPAAGASPWEISYRRPLKYRGYRFYYSKNRGYSLVFSYRPSTSPGPDPKGTVHLPSYSVYGRSQENIFSPPGSGFRIKARLLLGRPGRPLSPVPDPRVEISYYDTGAVFRETVLSPGEGVPLGSGRLTFYEVRLWNGYIVSYDPSLIVLLMASGLMVSGLVWGFLEGSRGYASL